jgi:arabinogalactan endo-1,4-beta-galactosidase
MLHYAGITNAEWYFQKVSSLDYDYIGLSYYPVWLRKSLTTLNDKMVSLSTTFTTKYLCRSSAYHLRFNGTIGQTTLLVENQLIQNMVQQMKDRKHLFIHSKSKKSKLKLSRFLLLGCRMGCFSWNRIYKWFIVGKSSFVGF